MVRIIINRKAIYSSLEIRVKPDQWDDKNKMIRKHPNATLLIKKITNKLSELQNIYLELERRKGNISISELKKQ